VIRQPIVLPRITAFFEAVRATPPPEVTAAAGSSSRPKVGAVGFCWGGRYTALMCSPLPSGGGPPADFGFTGHPSLLGIPDEVEAIAVPLSLANGENDEWMEAAALAKVRAILEREDKGGIHEIVIYEGAKHGFCNRGDPADPRQLEFGLQAEEQAVRWFKKQFAG
jgi:dienelactone hydrolase